MGGREKERGRLKQLKWKIKKWFHRIEYAKVLLKS